MALTLTSPAFSNNGAIPRQYTCDGGDQSPALIWSGIPPQAKSLVLIIEDPDAPDPAHPRAAWAHWLLYNLPPTTTGLNQGITDLPPGALEGRNDSKRLGYDGPCPPVGRHRYFHKLYALDTVLPDLKSPTKAKLEAAMQGHVIARAELIGTYQH